MRETRARALLMAALWLATGAAELHRSVGQALPSWYVLGAGAGCLLGALLADAAARAPVAARLGLAAACAGGLIPVQRWMLDRSLASPALVALSIGHTAAVIVAGRCLLAGWSERLWTAARLPIAVVLSIVLVVTTSGCAAQHEYAWHSRLPGSLIQKVNPDGTPVPYRPRPLVELVDGYALPGVVFIAAIAMGPRRARSP